MRCNICGNDTTELYDKAFDVNYFHCEKCEFIQMDEKKYISLEAEQDVYNLHNNSIEDEGYVNYFKKFIDLGVVPYKQNGTILDYGSGPEPVLSMILKEDYGYQVDIYDKFYQPTKVFAEKNYDAIVSTEVIEHIAKPIETFAIWHDHLKEDGILSLMTLFHYNDEERFLNWWYRRDWTHISFFSKKTLETVAKQTGFEMIFCDDKRICTFKKCRHS